MIRSFAGPGGSADQLTWQDNTLWHANSNTGLLYQIDPGTGRVIRSFAGPDANPHGITWDGRIMWMVDVVTLKIYQLAVS